YALIYVEADPATPFDLADLHGLTRMAGIRCDGPAAIIRRDRNIEKPNHLIIEDEKRNLPPTTVLIAEPGTTLGPETGPSIPPRNANSSPWRPRFYAWRFGLYRKSVLRQ